GRVESGDGFRSQPDRRAGERRRDGSGIDGGAVCPDLMRMNEQIPGNAEILKEVSLGESLLRFVEMDHMALIDCDPMQGFAAEVEQETNTVDRGSVSVCPVASAFHLRTYA